MKIGKWKALMSEQTNRMLSNCGAGEDSWESLGLQDQTRLINPKGNQPWTFTGRTDAEAEAPTLRPSDANSQHTGKDPDAGIDWWQEEKAVTKDEMVGWQHQLNGHESEQTLGHSGGQGAWRSAVHRTANRHNLVTTQQTTTNSWLEESSQECMKTLFTLWS